MQQTNTGTRGDILKEVKNYITITCSETLPLRKLYDHIIPLEPVEYLV